MKIKLSAVTDVGLQRDNNEDSAVVFTLPTAGNVAIVADGMGGANAGEVASALTVECIENCFRNTDLSEVLKSESQIHAFLIESIERANQSILDYVVKSPNAIGLGTTVVMIWIVMDKAYVAWCGDSRCYCYNPNEGLVLLTKDHSLVQEMVDDGRITQEEAFNHPDGNIITNCLGDVDAEPRPEVVMREISEGDLFVLCSDGLCGYCRDTQIESVIQQNYGNVDKCKKALLQLALDAGGEDNISIALCDTSGKESFFDFIRKTIKRTLK